MKKLIHQYLKYILIIAIIATFFGCGTENKGKLFLLHSPHETGVHFSNTLEETHEMNIISYPDFYSGGGVSVGDIDNDGLSDLFFVGNQQPCKLFMNLGGFKFKDITEEAGLSRMGRGWYTGTSMVDINADGFLDIYISKSGMEAPDDRANLLFINNQNGTFSERAEEFGLNHMGFGVNATFFDYDKDGDLDAYLTNQVAARLNSSHANQIRNVSDPYAGDKLYENMGNDSFRDVTKEAGLYSSEVGFAHGAAVGDIDNDGWEDLFVSNDFFEYDYLYFNNGDKTFTESIKESTNHISHFSMGNDLADFNNDGLLDLMVLDMVAEDNRRMYANTGGNDQQVFDRFVQYGLHYQYMFNVLHLNNGNETFSEIGMLAGISRTDWSWAPLFADFDNDGWKDLFVTNGLRKDIRNIDWGFSYRNLTQFVNDFSAFEASQWDMLLNTLPSEKVVNYIFKNNRDLTFEKSMMEWGIKEPSWSNGAAYGDLDNDGDLDLVVNNIDEPAFIYENLSANANYIRFKFEGPPRNPMGLGTKVKIYQGDNFQYQQHYSSRGYRSSVEPVMHFGVGKDTLLNKVIVTWPDGRVSMLENVRTNQVVNLDYRDSKSVPVMQNEKSPTIFHDVTDSLGVQIAHDDNVIIDYFREPMLPYKLSSVGMAFDVGDVNNDGLDDIFVGGPSNRPGQLFIQNADGSFGESDQSLFEEDARYDDTGALFFDFDNDGDMDLYVVSGGNEYPDRVELFQDRLYENDGDANFVKTEELLPEIRCSGSVVRASDYDQDGDPDLFVGGRMVAGHYPKPADSYLLINENGVFRDITDVKAAQLRQLGLVTDAVWADMDQDNDEDLVIVGEWMPITILMNKDGQLSLMDNVNNGLKYSTGWWWSIEANDLDNDGDQDLIAGNMGENYKFSASIESPLELYYGNFGYDDKTNFIIAYHQEGKIYPTVDRTKVVLQNSYVEDRIPTFNQYAISNLHEIYGKDKIDGATNKSIFTLKSSVIMNGGESTFEIVPLPNYAQVSNINDIVIRDIDGDQYKDLVIAGNLYEMEAETIRNDAGIGIWLRGDGTGNFSPVHYTESGLYVPGDVRFLKMLRHASGDLLVATKNDDFLQFIRPGQ